MLNTAGMVATTNAPGNLPKLYHLGYCAVVFIQMAIIEIMWME